MKILRLGVPHAPVRWAAAWTRWTAGRVRGATILETIVALTVISILFGIATTLCVRLATGTESIRNMRARSLLQLYADRTVIDKEFFDATELANGLILERRIDLMGGTGGLVRIHFSVTDSSKVVLNEWDQLVKNGK